jgi:hypothetical protein
MKQAWGNIKFCMPSTSYSSSNHNCSMPVMWLIGLLKMCIKSLMDFNKHQLTNPTEISLTCDLSPCLLCILLA